MYSYIKGIIKEIDPKYIVVENNGIGYLIIVANPFSFSLEEAIKIYVYQNVKEDLIELYGFKTKAEKDLFLKLISVSGIGPKSALSILAYGSVDEIIFAIESRNDSYLKKFPGIGAKASQQIILDLSGKLSYNSSVSSINPKLNDVTEALIALGYSKKELDKVVSKLDTNKSVEELIKDALKQMVK